MTEKPAPSGDLREQLRAAIDAAGRHQVTIASDLGVTTKHLCAMLTGRAKLTLEWAERIAAACGREVVVAVVDPDGDLRDRIDAALRTVGLARNLAAYRDAVLTVVEAALAQQAAEIDEDIIKPERALHEQTIQRAEQAERERDDYRQRFTNQMAAADELIRELRRAERLGAEALDAVAAERRDKLAAQAAVRRVRELADAANAEAERSLSRQFGGHPFPPFVSVADIRAALDAEQPKETP